MIGQKTHSLKKNYVYNLLLSFSNIVIPIIIFSYVSRILNPDGIGKINFSLSIVQYFVILAQIGIPLYGIREISKYRDDIKKVKKTFKEIYAIQFIAAAISFLLLFSVLSISRFLNDYKIIILIYSLNIFSMTLNAEWFFRGTENFKFLSIRTLIIQILSVLLVFLFVNDAGDIVIYAIVSVFVFLLTSILNMLTIRKKLHKIKIEISLDYRRHLKPILLLFMMSLSTSLYIILDKTFLGLYQGDYAVGIYTAANKIVKAMIAIITSLGVVLMPRISYYFKIQDKNKINTILRKSISYIFLLSIPITIGLFLFSGEIVHLFVGNDYNDSIYVLRIISFIIVFISMSNLIGIQVLVSANREKYTVISTVIGAGINLSLNIILIPNFSFIGAAISTLLSEFIVLAVQLFFAKKVINITYIFTSFVKYFLVSIVTIVPIYLVLKYMNLVGNLGLIINAFLSSILYLFILILIKDSIIQEILTEIKKFLQRRKINE